MSTEERNVKLLREGLGAFSRLFNRRAFEDEHSARADPGLDDRP